MKGVSKGNVEDLYNEKNNGWFIGHFVDDDPFRQTGNVGAKWKKHQPGEEGESFEADHSARSISILVEGAFEFEFRRGEETEKVLLERRGDYVIWLPNVPHQGSARKPNTIVITLRWPSTHGDHYDVT